MNQAGIREAHIKDSEKIQEIAIKAYTKYVQRIGKPPAPMQEDYRKTITEYQVYVIEKDEILGYMVLKEKNDHLLIDNIAVDPTHQGKGYGKTLMNHADKIAQELGFHELQLYTNEKMSENIAFYIYLGWSETNRVIEEGYNRVYMKKTLSQ